MPKKPPPNPPEGSDNTPKGIETKDGEGSYKPPPPTDHDDMTDIDIGPFTD